MMHDPSVAVRSVTPSKSRSFLETGTDLFHLYKGVSLPVGGRSTAVTQDRAIRAAALRMRLQDMLLEDSFVFRSPGPRRS